MFAGCSRSDQAVMIHLHSMPSIEILSSTTQAFHTLVNVTRLGTGVDQWVAVFQPAVSEGALPGQKHAKLEYGASTSLVEKNCKTQEHIAVFKMVLETLAQSIKFPEHVTIYEGIQGQVYWIHLPHPDHVARNSSSIDLCLTRHKFFPSATSTLESANNQGLGVGHRWEVGCSGRDFISL
jgi:hypothetical protein